MDFDLNVLTREIENTLKIASQANPSQIPDFDIEGVVKSMEPPKPKPVSNQDLANILSQDAGGIINDIYGNNVRDVSGGVDMSQMSDVAIHNQFVKQADQLEMGGGINLSGNTQEDRFSNMMSGLDGTHKQMVEMQEYYNNPSPELILG